MFAAWRANICPMLAHPAGDRLASKVRVRLIEPDDSLAHITGMLHRAYKQHADRGIKALAAFQPEEVTRRRIAGGDCYVAMYMGRIVGTILYRGPGQLSGTPWFERPDVATFSQFAVEPEFQGRGIGSSLVSLIESRAAQSGVSELALSTPEPAVWLVRMYERHGYRIVERVNWAETNYTSLIMSKAVKAAPEVHVGVNGVKA